jgi:cell division septation protein DedD
MTGPVTSGRRSWAVAAIATLALSSIAASCGLIDMATPPPFTAVIPASPSPIASPTPSLRTVTASPTPPTASPSPEEPLAPEPKPRWEAASTTFKTRANALKRLAKLRAKGFSGYRIEKDKKRYEVEKEFSTEKRAAAEVRRLARAGFRAKVELSTEPT